MLLVTNLIEMGRPFLQGPIEPAALIPRVSSVSESRAENFYGATVVIEVDHTAPGKHHAGRDESPQAGTPPYAVHAPAAFGPGQPRRLAAAATIPSGGGNKTGPLGTYPLPIYPKYDKPLNRLLGRPEKNTATNADEGREKMREFLGARASHTTTLGVSQEQTDAIADAAYLALADNVTEDYKGGAMIVVAEIGHRASPYYYSPLAPPDYLPASVEPGATSTAAGTRPPQHSAVLAHSRLHPGLLIRADLSAVLEGILASKVEEGAGLGELSDGNCSVCSRPGRVVALYSPNWPFAAKTWTAPLPQNGAIKQRGLGSYNRALETALCADCYKAFTIGTTMFKRLSRRLPQRIRAELSAPAHSGSGRQAALARARKQSNPPKELAAAFATPLISYARGASDGSGGGTGSEVGAEGSRGYARALAAMAEGRGRSMATLVGAETALPDEFTSDDYRITTVFYSQPNPTQEGVLELKAVIQDILPSRMLALEAVVRDLSFDPDLTRLADNLGVRSLSDRAMDTLPYLMGRAFGPSQFFERLSAALRSEALPQRPFREQAARRLRELSKNTPANVRAIKEEVYFYLAFEQFLADYHRHVAGASPADAHTSGAPDHYKEGAVSNATALLDTYKHQHPMHWPLQTQWEMGFAAGHVLRDFARRYYAGTQRDLLDNRVRPPVGDLTPYFITRRGLARIEEIARRTGVRVPKGLLERAAYVLDAYQFNQPTSIQDKDDFFVGFNCGYWTSKWISPADDEHPAQPEAGLGADESASQGREAS